MILSEDLNSIRNSASNHKQKMIMFNEKDSFNCRSSSSGNVITNPSIDKFDTLYNSVRDSDKQALFELYSKYNNNNSASGIMTHSDLNMYSSINKIKKNKGTISNKNKFLSNKSTKSSLNNNQEFLERSKQNEFKKMKSNRYTVCSGYRTGKGGKANFNNASFKKKYCKTMSSADKDSTYSNVRQLNNLLPKSFCGDEMCQSSIVDPFCVSDNKKGPIYTKKGIFFHNK